MAATTEKILLSQEDRQGKWGEALRADALQALSIAERRLGVKLDAPPRVESVAPERAFYERLGQSPHHILAVAIASDNLVVINRKPYLAAVRAERMQTLVHEFTHLTIGRRIPGGLPRWLDEGLAMVAAGETGFAYHSRIMIAASFGGLVPLNELWSGRADQELAYAQSLSATRHLLRSGATGVYLADPDDPSPLMRRLADPRRGRALRRLLRDPNFIRAFERDWRDSISSIWTWLAAVTGGTVFWGGLAALFLFAYYRKKQRAREKEEEWAAQDAAFPYLESGPELLTDDAEEWEWDYEEEW